MKNMMRRTVAFMLMACLLLSVMTPAAMAVTYVEAAQTYTYEVIDPQGRTQTGDYLTNLKSNTIQLPFDLTDFSFAGFGTGTGNIRLEQHDTEGYAVHLTSFHYYNNVAQTYHENNWIALKFNVARPGVYDIDFNQYIFFADVILEKFDSTKTYDDAYVAALTSQGKTYNGLDNVALEQGDYIAFFKADSQVRRNHAYFYSMTLTRHPDPDIATVTTNYSYDFTTLGALLGAAEGNHAGFGYSTAAQALFDEGKINYLPYAASGSFYSENGKYDYGIFGQNSAADTFFAVKISAAVGTYDFNAAMTDYAPAAGTGHIYAIPVSAVEAALATAQETDAEATAADAIYNLIQSDYAGKQSVEGSFYATSLSGTVEITSDEDYVIVFYAVAPRSGRTTYWMHFKNISLTKTASFNSLEAALADTDKFDTVTLLDDVDLDGVLNIGTGATLDLNGNALNGTLNVTDGNLVDSVGTGTVSNVAGLQATNKAVVVKDGATYRALSYTAKTNGYKVNTETNAIEFWFDADFAEDAYALLTSANGVTLNATLEVKGEQVTVDMTQKINDWVAKKGLTDEGENAGLGIAVTGFETLKAGDTITVTPVFETNTGVSGVFGGVITYTVPEA